mgnify:CR=1 FL=1
MRSARLTVVSTAFDTAPQLSDEELREELDLARGAASAEVRATVPEEHAYTTAAALEVDPLAARMRQAFFLDTPDLLLHQAGIVVRARRIRHGAPESDIRLRNVLPSELPGPVRRSTRFVVEVDAMPGSHVCSASLRGAPEDAAMREAIAGRRPLRKLFCKEQRRFFAAHAPAGIELDDLSVLGPIELAKVKFAPRELARKIRLEIWNYPDASRVIELATRCRPDEALDAIAEVRAFLTDRGIGLSAVQQAKTRTALEHFAARL